MENKHYICGRVTTLHCDESCEHSLPHRRYEADNCSNDYCDSEKLNGVTCILYTPPIKEANIILNGK